MRDGVLWWRRKHSRTVFVVFRARVDAQRLRKFRSRIDRESRRSFVGTVRTELVSRKLRGATLVVLNHAVALKTVTPTQIRLSLLQWFLSQRHHTVQYGVISEAHRMYERVRSPVSIVHLLGVVVVAEHAQSASVRHLAETLLEVGSHSSAIGRCCRLKSATQNNYLLKRRGLSIMHTC